MQFNDLLDKLPGKIDRKALLNLKSLCDRRWEIGDGPKYVKVLDQLVDIDADLIIENGVVKIQGNVNPSIAAMAKDLHYWRKGPFEVFGTKIDSEWRSDLKWNRLSVALPDLDGKNIVDVGCNNGYFMFRMLEHNPELVLGIDPCVQFNAQFNFINHFIRSPKLCFEMFGVENLGLMPNSFDVMFSMGILYHHRTPLQQLFDMRAALRNNGVLLLETIIIPGDEEIAITPRDRYCGMKNIWLLPTLNMLKLWLEKSKFHQIEVISTDWDGVEEQRSTQWAGSVSYESFLDPLDASKTIEGLPAPKRCILKAIVKK